ncbi:hypothetical protein Mp_2g19290 [Marchantia polymorpha subsp. ruderalis]|uniref:Uncharacterized protein n=1 Tax=Marchantia polymorpha TaxID=3197 RepID=A0A2R6WVJ7_MARPO|nr:hypothetical protein MARPO_0055s0123 [Marchantia polymorpha]BBN02917.1 hypothetical protein Mp_2g19290 [Marchantia polymorpha subsp. ruderalis]|eukprot:PTQ37875.1 hypothetical protein MARPO_0055s0123 [Marchantia polymorpha]
MLDLIFLLLLSLHPPGSLSLSLSQTKTSDPPEIKCPDHLSSANARNRPRGPFPSLPSRPPSLPICGLLPFYPLANRLESSPPLLVFPVPPSSSQSSQQPPPPPPLPSPEPAPPGVPMFPQKDLPSLRPSSARPSLRSSVVCLPTQPWAPSFPRARALIKHGPGTGPPRHAPDVCVRRRRLPRETIKAFLRPSSSSSSAAAPALESPPTFSTPAAPVSLGRTAQPASQPGPPFLAVAPLLLLKKLSSSAAARLVSSRRRSRSPDRQYERDPGTADRGPQDGMGWGRASPAVRRTEEGTTMTGPECSLPGRGCSQWALIADPFKPWSIRRRALLELCGGLVRLLAQLSDQACDRLELPPLTRKIGGFPELI